jgi:hypothetical protein
MRAVKPFELGLGVGEDLAHDFGRFGDVVGDFVVLMEDDRLIWNEIYRC